MAAAGGWYPIGNGQEAYWDGRAWTDRRRPAVPVYPSAAAPGPPDPLDGLCVAGMVLGIVSLVVPFYGLLAAVPGIVLSAVGIGRTPLGGHRRGRGMAIAGLVCSIVALAMWGFVILLLWSIVWSSGY